MLVFNIYNYKTHKKVNDKPFKTFDEANEWLSTFVKDTDDIIFYCIRSEIEI